MNPYLHHGLGSLASLSKATTRSISAENPEGLVGGGGRAAPDADGPAAALGVGWKARPCITLPAESTTVIADIQETGIIQHIWMTVAQVAYRKCILRIFWDDETSPSVEVPLGDFFANGHGQRYNVNSMPVAVNPSGGFNCYWPMPFRGSCRMTIENRHKIDIEGFYYQITYGQTEVPEDSAYFHARWRREVTNSAQPEFAILDGVEGQGHYVGTFLSWLQGAAGWWGEGEVKFFMDGDRDYPTICGTGTEDYFGGAWSIGETYSTPYLGYPYHGQDSAGIPTHCLYRWHVMDPIRFKTDLRVTIQTLGLDPGGKFQPLAEDIASVAYWYQTEPHKKYTTLMLS